MTSRRVITTVCPAKLNLLLAVDPPREDGMHPIASWMVTLDLVDDLEVVRLEPDRFSRYAILWHDDARSRSDIDWPITSDLAVRAHLALEAHVGRSLPVQMKLEKRIPVGGGLGGGSSNAAAMLRAVNELHDLELDDATLESIAATLGSDVPFLVRGGSAIVEGMGETLLRHDDVPSFHAVLVFPGYPCPTGAVYTAFDDDPPASSRVSEVRTLGGAGVPAPDALFNDLAAPAVRVAPDLAGHREQVAVIAEGPVHVSGSGSTLFVPCSDALHAGHLALAVQERTELAAVPVAARGIEESILEEIP
ncbi:MAG: hypothetical protein VX727_08850 [Planctomycetota bacterium]|nr:hypothetical protein [Planctomycetota bacterium]